MARGYLTKLLSFKFKYDDLEPSGKRHKRKKKTGGSSLSTPETAAICQTEPDIDTSANQVYPCLQSPPVTTSDDLTPIDSPCGLTQSCPSDRPSIATHVNDHQESVPMLRAPSDTPHTRGDGLISLRSETTYTGVDNQIIPLAELRGNMPELRVDPDWLSIGADAPPDLNIQGTTPPGPTFFTGITLEIRTHCIYLRHNNETEVIPMGLAQGWPTSIDFAALYTRVKSLSGHLWMIARKEHPSEFFENALLDWATLGRTKCQSVFYDINSFDVEQPGYYGPQGFDVINQTLYPHFVGSGNTMTDRLAHPLSPEYFLRKVLIPEVALALIAEDLQLTPQDPLVLKTLEESQKYGLAMFPDDDSS
ncbi:hypothetical protein PGTUg99_018938 [Puccinia graminis f. sp. tritici]|uniref:Restriction of telomere capping protein 4 n=1 Tax=Puccinia graminis f. sp. tritici TaxID=56615 RepID=A0A5B0RKT7_PUCGR|nr:hypothetical protein PGTUg99_018938 [Puccinia graminis f. sp. tritici]